MLGVPAATIKRYGAVSAETATAMAKGALKHSLADIAVAITGIAGPGGGSKQKPVGLVHFAAASRDGCRLALVKRYGDIGRAIVAPPCVAEETVAALRAAFLQAMQDAELIAEARAEGLDLDPLPGERLQQIVGETQRVTPDVIARARKFSGGN